ncbi:MAG: hypothetical protein HY914_20555 [Desulfomonile tiedjei]|nr:hypothetical protein [Desulfomonile tiedjei]
MAGAKFLKPTSKIVLCILGMMIMAYFIYPDLTAGTLSDRLTILRIAVFIGFAYLLVQSVREREKSSGR